MRSLKPLLLLAVVAIAAVLWNRHAPPSAPPVPSPTTALPAQAPRQDPAAPPGSTNAGTEKPARLPAFLPAEARNTLALIARGGPFPHRQDGTVFGNREGRLPARPRGYYHEYTVDTPGLDYRGARRIITGGNPPVVYYYTDDHYRTFRTFEVPR